MSGGGGGGGSSSSSGTGKRKGGSSGGSGSGGVDSGNNCIQIFRGARLSSPKPDVITNLMVGDSLTLETRKYKDSFVLYAITDSGKEAGTVISSSAARITQCIQKGYSYIAIVKVIDGGNCILEIRPKG